MEVKIYTGKKNDLVIGLIKRWTLTDKDMTIVITLNKVEGGFEIKQWAMDSEGNDIESLSLLTTPYKKKYYATQEVHKMVKEYIPNFGERKIFTKKRK